MKLKSFNEFTASLTKEKIQAIKEDVKNQIKLGESGGGDTSTSLLIGVSVKFSMRLLNEYHNWLSQQIQETSPDD